MKDESPAESTSSFVSSVSSATMAICSKCGQLSSGTALGGLCEGCLMRVGLGIGTTGDAGAANQDIASIFEDLDAENERLPREFGDYELLEEIGIGGMGVIYKAKHLGLGRIVALKMIKAGELAKRDDVRRFKAEAEAAARLRHPNIVTIHDIGEEEGLPYFSMSYVGGPNLGQLVRMQPLAARRAATILRKIAMAVQHAHDEGLLHRDLKPGNILIDPSDEPQVTDFGLARAIHSDSSLTRTGAILGSPSYMSPEQAEGRMKDVDVRTDVYSLGAVLYEMLTGRPPFQGESAMHTLRLVCSAEPAAPRLLNPDVPQDLETVCLRCLEKQPLRRYGSAREVALEMEAFLEGRPIKSRPVGPAGRLLRWCRRQPALAALSLALILAITGGMIGMALGWGEARRKAADEQVARKAAEAGERRASLGVYNSDMMMASLAAQEPNRSRLIELLDLHDPAIHPGITDLRSWEWYHLKKQTRGEELYTLGHHKHALGAIAISPDGQWAASADRGGVLMIWDLEKRAVVAELPVGSKSSASITFSPDGAWLAVAWESGHSSLWRTGNWMAPALSWRRSQCGYIVFSPDSASLYQAGGSVLKRFTLHKEGETFTEAETVFELPRAWWVLPVYQPGARDIILMNKSVSTWDGDRQEFTGVSWRAEGVDMYATMLKLERGGDRLAGWFNDDCLYILDRKTLQPTLRLRGQRNAVFDAAFSRDGKYLASGGADQSVHLWNLETGERIRRFSGHTDTVFAVAFSPDGSQILSGAGDGTILAWSTSPPPPPEGQLVRTGRNASLSTDGHVLTERHDGDTVTLYAIRSGNLLARMDASTFRDTTTGPDGNPFVILHHDGALELQSPGDNGYTPQARIEAGKAAGGGTILLSSDGGLLLLQFGSTAVIYETSSLKEQQRFSWPSQHGGIETLAFSLDARQVAFAFVDHSISIWDWKAGKQTALVKGDDSRHPGINFSPDGTMLACASFGGGAQVWDVTASPPRRIFTSPAHDVSWSVDFTPDNRRLAVGLDTGDIAFWDITSGTCVMQFKNQGVPAISMLFDPADHHLVTLTANRVTRKSIAPGFLPGAAVPAKVPMEPAGKTTD